MKKIFYVLLFLSIAYPLWATTYYVCDDATDCNAGDGSGWSTGNNGNNGTAKSTPWLTLDYAEDTISSGDTVIVGDGTYAAWTITAGWVSETTFISENKWGASINNIVFSGDGAADYITIQNFELTPSGSTAGGISFGSTTGIDHTDVSIIGNKIHGYTCSSFGAIWVGMGTNVLIDGNEIYDCGPTGNENNDHGIYLSWDTDNITVQNNIIYGIPDGYPIHAYHDDQNDFTIVNNTLYSENTYGYPQCIVLWGTISNMVVRNNLCYDPVGSSYGVRLEGTHTGTLVMTNNVTNAATLCTGTECGDYTTSDNITSADLSDEFTNAAGKIFTLQSDAVAIGAGIATDAPSEDFIGTARPQNTTYDVGAYEYLFVPPDLNHIGPGSGTISAGSGSMAGQ